ncbi:MAG: M28 family peptidase [Ignisphaera sp.]
MSFDEVKHVIDYVSRFSSIGEVVAGSTREYQQIELIKSAVEDYVDEIVIEPVEVSTWDEEFCTIYLDGEIFRCSIHPPYEGYIDINTSRNNIVYIHDISLLNNAKSNLEEKVVIVSDVDDPNYIAVYTHILKVYRPMAIIFIDIYEALRRIVVLDDIVSSQKPTIPSRIPVIHIPKNVGKKLLNSRYIHIAAKSILKFSYGYNVVAKLNNASDKYIYITSHHDHWFNGVTDDSVGVALMLNISRNPMTRRGLREGITLAFFTAEEGFPYPLSSFYWLVGSRKHVAGNADRLLEDVLFVLNLDVLYRGRLRFSTSSLVARGFLANIGIDIDSLENDSMFFDSFSFTSLGIPSITIHSYNEVLRSGLYHSTLDTIDMIDIDSISYTLSVIYKLIRNSHMIKSNIKKLLELGAKTIAMELMKTIKPLEVILNLYRVLRLFLDCLDSNTLVNYMYSFHRIITTTYISRDVYKGLKIYEETSYIDCRDEYMYLPIDPLFNNADDCYRNILFNLESLAYILLKYCKDIEVVQQNE